jgi:hypothetical protein
MRPLQVVVFMQIVPPKPPNGFERDALEMHMADEKIEQRAYTRRQRATLAHIEGVELFEIAGIGLFKHRHQAPGIDIGAHGEGGKAGKAGA